LEETLSAHCAEILSNPAEIGDVLANDILKAIAAAHAGGRQFLLGCPSGRSPKPIYDAMADKAKAGNLNLSNLVLVMMDEYLGGGDDGLGLCPPDAHNSCRRFAEYEIRQRLNAGVETAHQIPEDHVWFPDAANPGAYDDRITAAGGVDLFILASGATDGHVAFNPPGSPADGPSCIVKLAEETRRDNLGTFPNFPSLDAVPHHGLTVGLGTIANLSKAVAMVIHGAHKREAAKRLTQSDRFDPQWPATIIHRCKQVRILLDTAAAGRA
jgi:glucosamine-6-phosphate deaminase